MFLLQLCLLRLLRRRRIADGGPLWLLFLDWMQLRSEGCLQKTDQAAEWGRLWEIDIENDRQTIPHSAMLPFRAGLNLHDPRPFHYAAPGRVQLRQYRLSIPWLFARLTSDTAFHCSWHLVDNLLVYHGAAWLVRVHWLWLLLDEPRRKLLQSAIPRPATTRIEWSSLALATLE